MRSARDRKRTSAGIASVELAAVSALLMLMVFGSIDFGRMFVDAITLSNATGSGLLYGLQNRQAGGELNKIVEFSHGDAVDLAADENVVTYTATNESREETRGGIDYEANQLCACPNQNSTQLSSCSGFSCPGSLSPRVYVELRVEKDFETMIAYPGIPDEVRVAKVRYLRVW